MNRVDFLPAGQTATDEPAATNQLATPYESRQPAKAIFVPLKYEESHAYPLLVWLHDQGENEAAMRKMVPRASLRNFVAVGVCGTAADSVGGGHTWEQTIEGIHAATGAVMSGIRDLKTRYNIDPKHIFIAGSGVGGSMALRIGHNHADWFAGCASLGGPFPSSLRPLRCINRSRGLDVMIANSRLFADYPTAQFCDDVRLMFSAGSQVLMREYGDSDDLYKPMLRDLNRWLMGIVTQQFLFESEDMVGSIQRN